MPVRVDWSKPADYVRQRHAIEPIWGLTVVLVDADADPGERPDADW